jgi:hypothetical protein
MILMFLCAAYSLIADQSDSANVSVTPTISLILDYDLQFRVAYYSNIDYIHRQSLNLQLFFQYLNL